MRIFDIIKLDLNSDKLKVEAELERVLNDKSLETDDKVATIKKLLMDIATIEMAFEKFKGYTTDEVDVELTKE
jgi:hypothetical protein